MCMSCIHNIVFTFKEKKGESDSSSAQPNETDDEIVARQTERDHHEDLLILNDEDQVR